MPTAAISPAQARRFRENCERDVSYFSRAALREHLWSKQLELKRSVRNHRRTLVISGHGTGKSRCLGEIACEWMATKERANVVCTAGTNAQVHEVLWTRIQTIYEQAERNGVPLGGEMQEGFWKGTTPDSFAVAKSVDKPSAMHGVHGPNVLILVDEAEGVERDMWRAIDSLMSSGGSRLVLTFNPWDPSGYCFEAFNRPDLWNIVHVSCLDHPNVVSGEEVIRGAVTRQWVDEVRQAEGEDSARWSVQVLGKFPKEGSTKQLISMGDLESSVDGGTAVDEEPRAGFDVARFGGDRNVVVVFDARRRMVARESWTGSDLMASAGRALQLSRRYHARLRVDSCGLGAGVVDRLREQGHAVDAVDFSTAQRNDWSGTIPRGTEFKNRRAELHWVTRTLLREKAISIPREFRDVWADLVVPEYDYDSSARIVIEEKEKIRARIGRSPDFGDAVHIAMSNGKRGRF